MKLLKLLKEAVEAKTLYCYMSLDDLIKTLDSNQLKIDMSIEFNRDKDYLKKPTSPKYKLGRITIDENKLLQDNYIISPERKDQSLEITDMDKNNLITNIKKYIIEISIDKEATIKHIEYSIHNSFLQYNPGVSSKPYREDMEKEAVEDFNKLYEKIKSYGISIKEEKLI